MSKFARGKRLFYANKYQKKIIALALVPSLIICLIMTVMVKIFYGEFVDMILFSSDVKLIQFMYNWGVVILSALWIFFGIIFLVAFAVSSNLVGAFERIIRELDDIISGKKKKQKIKARVKDDLANDILERINALIEKISS